MKKPRTPPPLTAERAEELARIIVPHEGCESDYSHEEIASALAELVWGVAEIGGGEAGRELAYRASSGAFSMTGVGAALDSFIETARLNPVRVKGGD